MKKLLFVILIAETTAHLFSQPIPPKERDILQLQDQRSLGDGKLVTYLQDKNPHLRYRAAIALANIQNPNTLAALSASLKDLNVDVRRASAFALGALGVSQAEDTLYISLLREKNGEVLAVVMESLGKCGSVKSLDSLIGLSTAWPRKLPKKVLALTIARFAIRQIKTERSIWKCFELLSEKAPDVRSAALYALWRSSPSGLVDLEITKMTNDLIGLAQDAHADVRMQLAILLGKSKSKNVKDILDVLVQSEKKYNDWHVWIQLIRACVFYSAIDKEILQELPKYLLMKNNHIRIASLQALTTFTKDQFAQCEVCDSIKQILLTFTNRDNQETESVRGEALVALGIHFPRELDRYSNWIADTETSARLKAKFLEGISQEKNRSHLDLLLANLDNESVRVSMAAWDFIRQMLSPSVLQAIGLDSTTRAELPYFILGKAKIALARNDMGITTVVANLFADTSIFAMLSRNGYADQVVDEFIAAFQGLTRADDSEAKQSLLQALGSFKNTRAVSFLEKAVLDSNPSVANEAAVSLRQITGKDYSAQVPVHRISPISESDWDLLARINPKQKLQFLTNHGKITIELMKEYAPFTVLNFVKLVKRGFYNGLCFHRVVPDFVVQGGDPRGDGWGGPGYAIRTEVGLVHFEQGSCGIASAGKDTEGCQFFITHLVAPHLDGRYSIFAKVVKGMEVVDQIQIGDTIQSVRLEH